MHSFSTKDLLYSGKDRQNLFEEFKQNSFFDDIISNQVVPDNIANASVAELFTNWNDNESSSQAKKHRYLNQQDFISVKGNPGFTPPPSPSTTATPSSLPRISTEAHFVVPQSPSISSPPSSPMVYKHDTQPKRYNVTTAKAQLSDLVGGVTTLEQFFTKTSSLLYMLVDAKIAAVFVRRANRDAHISSYMWNIECEFPVSGTLDSIGFPGSKETILERCALEKRCVNYSFSSGFCYIFVPMAVHEDGSSHVIYAFVMNDNQDAMEFFEEIRKPMGFWMKSIMCNQHNRSLVAKSDLTTRQLLFEKEINKVQRSLVSLLINIDNGEYDGTELLLIVLNPSGGIINVSRKVTEMLGYLPSEIINLRSVIDMHPPEEIASRARELESELNRSFPVGFQVLVYKTLISGTRVQNSVWTLKKKDGSSILVNITMRPLWDGQKILGFVEIIKYCTSFM